MSRSDGRPDGRRNNGKRFPYRRKTKRDASGKRRECLLSRVERTMRGRAHGHSTKSPWLYVAGWPWKTYDEFRRWALASGFSKATPSPDRERTSEPYGPRNVVWRTVAENRANQHGSAKFSDYHVRGQEPPAYYDDVPF